MTGGDGQPQRMNRKGATLGGLLLALAAPASYAAVVRPLMIDAGMESLLESIVGLLVMWALMLSVIALVRLGERRPLSSIGLHRPSLRIVLTSVLIGIVLSVAVPALSIVSAIVLPAGEAGSIASAAQNPWWLILLGVITAGVTEEVLFRGYALERLYEWTGSRLVSSVVAVAFFTAVHASGWNAAHVVGVVLPLGAALTGLYWWRRDLVTVIVAHIVIDLPLVFLAAQQ